MELELGALALLVAGGFAVGFVNVVAGGGSLIAMPLLVFLGLPATSANGTARLAILVQGLTAIATYQRRGVIPWRRIGPLVVPVALGALGGSYLAVHTSDAMLEGVIGGVTLGAALLVAASPERAFAAETRGRTWALWLGLLVAGAYGGYVQAGVGYLLLAAIAVLGGWPLVQANIAKVVLVTAYTPVVLVLFASADQVELLPAAALALGAAVGGFAGASTSLERGAPLIRGLLVLAGFGAGVKLLL